MILRPTLVERLLHRLHLLPMPVMDAFGSVLYGRALSIGVRRGIFEALAEGALLADEIAALTKLDVTGVELLLESFVQGGYLIRRGFRFGLSAEGRVWLLKSSPRYIGNLIAYFETLYARWGHLEYSLEHGSPPAPYYAVFEERDWEIYVHGMRDLAILLMDAVMQNLTLVVGARALLDLGGSHGVYAMECCRRYPTLHATVMDFEPAVRHARVIIDGAGMTDRVTLLGGDFTKTELPRDQDGVLMFNIIHGFNESENRKLVAQALAALKPKGKIFILDQFRSKNRASLWRSSGSLSRMIPLMVGLNLLNEIGGNAYSIEQVKHWCAGVSSVRRLRLQLPGVEMVEIMK